MAPSSVPSRAQRARSSEADLWHMSWGEKESIGALKAEMVQTVQVTWQSERCFAVNHNSPWCQVQGQPQGQPQAIFQPVCFMMARIPGTQADVPAIVVNTQHEILPVEPAPLRQVPGPDCKQNPSCVLPRHTQGDHRGSAPLDCAKADSEQGLISESFEGELPSVGSKGHLDGSCKRCAFFSKGRCKNGKDCTHCHCAHETRSRLRKLNPHRVRQSSHAEDAAPEDGFAKPCSTVREYLSEDDDILGILSYSTDPKVVADTSNECDPVDVAGGASPSDSDTDRAMLLAEVVVKDARVAASIMRFNNALQEAAKTYMSDTEDHAAKDAQLACDTSDVNTTPSVSALSDVEEGASLETSDSEIASLHGSTPSSNNFDAVPSSPTSWRAGQRSRKATSIGGCTTVDIKRMTRSLLNKLTTERFEPLCKQILALPLSTVEHLAVVAAEIFAKATTQDCFRSLYTELCIRLDAHLAAQASNVGGKAFRRALVSACQATFERHLKPAETALFVDLTDEECFEVHMKLKTRRLGNMRFIGDLLVRRLLAPRLLPKIVHELLSGNEDALESLIALITVVAPEFEEKTSLYQAPLRDVFQVLRHKLNNKSVCSRMCCQISDLFDAKARSWAPRSTPA